MQRLIRVTTMKVSPLPLLAGCTCSHSQVLQLRLLLPIPPYAFVSADVALVRIVSAAAASAPLISSSTSASPLRSHARPPPKKPSRGRRGAPRPAGLPCHRCDGDSFPESSPTSGPARPRRSKDLKRGRVVKEATGGGAGLAERNCEHLSEAQRRAKVL